MLQDVQSVEENIDYKKTIRLDVWYCFVVLKLPFFQRCEG